MGHQRESSKVDAGYAGEGSEQGQVWAADFKLTYWSQVFIAMLSVGIWGCSQRKAKEGGPLSPARSVHAP